MNSIREIKFRGWNNSWKGWVIGGHSYFEGLDDTYIIIFDHDKMCPDTGYRENKLTHVPVDHKTIGQYTGLKDKNGVEIYAGDLLRIDIIHSGYPEYKFDGIYEVIITEYSGVRLRFIELAYEDTKKRNQYPIHQWIDANNIFPRWSSEEGICINIMYDGEEIKSTSINLVGNVHENPELLK